MLQAMRQNTRIILWVTVVAFVLLIFLVWGADLRSGGVGGGQTSGAIGTVNGEPIPYTAYQSVLARNRESAAAQGRDLQPSDYLMIEEQTWDSIVDEMLLLQEAKRRGLEAKDSEVRAVLLTDPPAFIKAEPTFQDTSGRFDMNRYLQFVRDPNTPESILLQIEAMVRAQLPFDKLRGIVESGVKVSDEEVRRAFEDENERIDLTYVLVDAQSQPIDSGDPTEGEIRAHFDENQDKYRLPERADLVYVTIPRRATAGDSAQIQTDLRDFAREARAAEEAARTGREELSLSDFAGLAMTFSDAPTAESGGLSSGYLATTEMSGAMRRVVEDLGVGQISEPFRDGAFYRIVKIEDEQTEEDVRRVQVREIALRIAPSDSSVAALRDRMDAVRQAAQASGLVKAAEAESLAVQRAGDVTEAGIAPGLSSIPNLASFALRNPTGTLSRVYETNLGWFLVEIAERKPAGVPDFAAVQDRVRQDVIQERRFQAARAAAQEVHDRVRQGATLEDAALADSLTAAPAPGVTRISGMPGLGREPEVLGPLFALNAGEVSEPLRAARGWVIARLDQRQEPDEAAFAAQKENIRRNLTTLRQSQVFNAWLEDLRKSAKIDDYRLES